MATLTAGQLAELRRGAAKEINNIGYTRPQINAALQSVEDYYEATARAGFNQAIETAAPGVFTTAQKKKVVKAYLLLKYGLE